MFLHQKEKMSFACLMSPDGTERTILSGPPIPHAKPIPRADNSAALHTSRSFEMFDNFRIFNLSLYNWSKQIGFANLFERNSEFYIFLKFHIPRRGNTSQLGCLCVKMRNLVITRRVGKSAFPEIISAGSRVDEQFPNNCR